MGHDTDIQGQVFQGRMVMTGPRGFLRRTLLAVPRDSWGESSEQFPGVFWGEWCERFPGVFWGEWSERFPGVFWDACFCGSLGFSGTTVFVIPSSLLGRMVRAVPMGFPRTNDPSGT